ncbi:MAG: FAD/NAD(P)-binding protein [Terriglobales bacterium]|jgi:uncharacterized NAD(P)/FAD-binding protein YdhS
MNGKQRSGFTIAIVGGGFTGAMLAVQLFRTADKSVSVVLIERGGVPGLGVAYGTQFEGHLLNVRANDMSAYPDIPDHFFNWAQVHYNSSVKADDFLPRSVYGQYIASQFQEARQLHPSRLRCIQGEAVSLTPTGGLTSVLLADGQIVLADKVVISIGHFPPGEPSLPGKTAASSRYLANPWATNTVREVSQGNSVLLIGSGLTSLDMVIELRARGFGGTIHILSRRGLLPQSHKITAPFAPFRTEDLPLTVRGLVRLIRRQIKAAESEGSDWRAVMDSLRPLTQEIWRTLPRPEQRRFLRHLRTYWEVHRHRIAGQIANRLALQLQSGQIQMHAGRIMEYREDSAGVEISYRARKHGETVRLHVDRVVNCTGPESNYRRVNSPLLQDLMNKGLARPDELSLGLDVSGDGALVDAQGKPSDFLYTLGPLRKGNLWETIAVPEIRVQAAEMARLLTGHKPEDAKDASSAAETELSTSLDR